MSGNSRGGDGVHMLLADYYTAAPVGAKVDYVPDGASSETIDGVTYFVYSNTYYQPFYSGPKVVYIMANKPETEAGIKHSSLDPNSK